MDRFGWWLLIVFLIKIIIDLDKLLTVVNILMENRKEIGIYYIKKISCKY